MQLLAGTFVAGLFSFALVTGCQPEEPVGPEGGGFDIEPQEPMEQPEAEDVEEFPQPQVEIDEPDPEEIAGNAEEGEPVEMPEADEVEPVDPDELDVLEEGMPEPEEVDIEDPDRDPDTVLATVDDVFEITLQNLYDEFAAIPVHQQAQMEHRLPELLEQMIQHELLLQKAEEKEVTETEHYQDIVRQIEGMPMAEDLDEEEIRESARMETLLQQEVVQKVDVSEEQLRELFEQYQQMMPEDADFEQMRPQLEQMVLHDHVNDYIQNLFAEAEVEIDEDWVEEKEREAEEAQPQMPQMPPQQ